MKSTELLKIFANLGFNIKADSIFGNVIEMSAEEAFIFSAITGAKYLFYENGITMKGRYEVFIHRAIFSNNHLIYSPGLFSRTINGYIKEGNSSRYLLRTYPQLFSGNKKIVLYDIMPKQISNIENEVYNQIVNANLDVDNYLLYKNFLSNNVGESLLEYFASLYFINRGYLVENQVPWFQQNYKYKGMVLQGGIPDFSAFNASISNLLYKYNFIDNKGIPLCLLPVIKLFRRNIFDKLGKQEKIYNYSLLIGEAKTSINSLPQAIKQLEKYNAVNLASQLFTIIPNSQTNEQYGSLYVSDDFSLIYNPGNLYSVDLERSAIDDKWISTYIKMLLLGNLNFEDIIKFIINFRKNNSLSKLEHYQSSHLIDAIQNTDDESFFKFFREALNGVYE